MRLIVLVAFLLSLLPLPVNAATTVKYRFYMYYDGNVNNTADYFGQDDCMGGTLTVTEVVPAGQLGQYFTVPLLVQTHDILTWNQMVACKQNSSADYTIKVGAQYRITANGRTTVFTALSSAGVLIAAHRLPPASGE